MRAVVIGLIFAAVILAGGTAYLLRSYLTSQEAEFASRTPKAPTTQVMVAAIDMPTGTVINVKNIDWQPWPEEAIQEDFLAQTRDKNPLDGLLKDKHVTRRSFTKGEPITMAKLYKSDDPGFLRGTLSPGMRAVAVRSSAETSASGFVLPGDRVDIILTHQMIRRAMDQQVSEEPQSILAFEHTSETILEDLRVLAVDQKVNEFESGAVLAKTVLLEVTPKQVEIIHAAKNMGKLSLSLRSAEDGEPRTGRPFTTDVEVSPILSSFENLMAGDNGGQRGSRFSQSDDEFADGAGEDSLNEVPAPILAPAPQAPLTASKPAPQRARSMARTPTAKRKITVYRGAGGDGGDAADTLGTEGEEDEMEDEEDEIQ